MIFYNCEKSKLIKRKGELENPTNCETKIMIDISYKTLSHPSDVDYFGHWAINRRIIEPIEQEDKIALPQHTKGFQNNVKWYLVEIKGCHVLSIRAKLTLWDWKTSQKFYFYNTSGTVAVFRFGFGLGGSGWFGSVLTRFGQLETRKLARNPSVVITPIWSHQYQLPQTFRQRFMTCVLKLRFRTV